MDKNILPFHEWKDIQVKKDSKEHNVFRFYKEREWYYKEYGKYVNANRKR